jgi:hypothetical protein
MRMGNFGCSHKARREQVKNNLFKKLRIDEKWKENPIVNMSNSLFSFLRMRMRTFRNSRQERETFNVLIKQDEKRSR